MFQGGMNLHNKVKANLTQKKIFLLSLICPNRLIMINNFKVLVCCYKFSYLFITTKVH